MMGTHGQTPYQIEKLSWPPSAGSDSRQNLKETVLDPVETRRGASVFLAKLLALHNGQWGLSSHMLKGLLQVLKEGEESQEPRAAPLSLWPARY